MRRFLFFSVLGIMKVIVRLLVLVHQSTSVRAYSTMERRSAWRRRREPMTPKGHSRSESKEMRRGKVQTDTAVNKKCVLDLGRFSS